MSTSHDWVCVNCVHASASEAIQDFACKQDTKTPTKGHPKKMLANKSSSSFVKVACVVIFVTLWTVQMLAVKVMLLNVCFISLVSILYGIPGIYTYILYTPNYYL